MIIKELHIERNKKTNKIVEMTIHTYENGSFLKYGQIWGHMIDTKTIIPADYSKYDAITENLKMSYKGDTGTRTCYSYVLAVEGV